MPKDQNTDPDTSDDDAPDEPDSMVEADRANGEGDPTSEGDD